jgi:hypothetical protein
LAWFDARVLGRWDIVNTSVNDWGGGPNEGNVLFPAFKSEFTEKKAKANITGRDLPQWIWRGTMYV